MRPTRPVCNALYGLLAGAACAALAACSSGAPTQQLVDARRAYDSALQSPATRYTPEQLLAAREALDRAEAAHNNNPGSRVEAHLGYLAARKAQIAVVNSLVAQAEMAESQAKASYETKRQKPDTLEGP